MGGLPSPTPGVNNPNEGDTFPLIEVANPTYSADGNESILFWCTDHGRKKNVRKQYHLIAVETQQTLQWAGNSPQPLQQSRTTTESRGGVTKNESYVQTQSRLC